MSILDELSKPSTKLQTDSLIDDAFELLKDWRSGNNLKGIKKEAEICKSKRLTDHMKAYLGLSEFQLLEKFGYPNELEYYSRMWNTPNPEDGK